MKISNHVVNQNQLSTIAIKIEATIVQVRQAVVGIYFNKYFSYDLNQISNEAVKLVRIGHSDTLVDALKQELKGCVYSFFHKENLINFSMYPCSGLQTTVERYNYHVERVEIICELFYSLNQDQSLSNYCKELLNSCLSDSNERDGILASFCTNLNNIYRNEDVQTISTLVANQMMDEFEFEVFCAQRNNLSNKEWEDRQLDIISVCGWNNSFESVFIKMSLQWFNTNLCSVFTNKYNRLDNNIKLNRCQYDLMIDYIIRANYHYKQEVIRAKHYRINPNYLVELCKLLYFNLKDYIQQNLLEFLQSKKLEFLLDYIDLVRDKQSLWNELFENLLRATEKMHFSYSNTVKQYEFNYANLEKHMQTIDYLSKYLQKTLTDNRQFHDRFNSLLNKSLSRNSDMPGFISIYINYLVTQNDTISDDNINKICKALSVSKYFGSRKIVEYSKLLLVVRISQWIFSRNINDNLLKESTLINIFKQEANSVDVTCMSDMVEEISGAIDYYKVLDRHSRDNQVYMNFRSLHSKNIKELSSFNFDKIEILKYFYQFEGYLPKYDKLVFKNKGKRKYFCNIILDKMELNFECAKTITIKCDMLCALILLAFNSNYTNSSRSLSNIIKIDANIIEVYMQSLVKLNIIISRTDDYIVNDNYRQQETTLNISTPYSVLLKNDQNSGKQKDEFDFAIVVNACITRIVKKHKSISRKALFDAVKCRFNKLTIMYFNERTAKLIEDEYIYSHKQDNEVIFTWNE